MDLPQTAILRNLPLVVEGKTRIELEGMLLAVDAAVISLNRFVKNAQQISCDDYEDLAGRELFLDAWAIVDCAYAFWEISKNKDPSGPNFTAFKVCIQNICAMRSMFRHVGQRAGNLSIRKGNFPPVFGIIYFWKHVASNIDFSDPNRKDLDFIAERHIFVSGGVSDYSGESTAPAKLEGEMILRPTLVANDCELELREVVKYMIGAVEGLNQAMLTQLEKKRISAEQDRGDFDPWSRDKVPVIRVGVLKE